MIVVPLLLGDDNICIVNFFPSHCIQIFLLNKIIDVLLLLLDLTLAGEILLLHFGPFSKHLYVQKLEGLTFWYPKKLNLYDV